MTATPEPFHLLARGRKHWLAIAELVLVVVLFFVLQIVAYILFMVVYEDESEMLDVFILAATIPAPFLAAWIARRNPTALLSVAKRVRWPLVWRPLVVAGPAYAAVFAVEATADDAVITAATVTAALIYVVVVPLQAASEELVFRAALPQLVGTWLRSPWLAYALPIPVFVALHGYNWIGLIDIVCFSVFASYLTWRTNGLEAAIVLHATGNISVFAAQALHPDEPPPTDIAWQDATVSVLFTFAVTVAIVLLLRKDGRKERLRAKDSQNSTVEFQDATVDRPLPR